MLKGQFLKGEDLMGSMLWWDCLNPPALSWHGAKIPKADFLSFWMGVFMFSLCLINITKEYTGAFMNKKNL